MRRDLKIYWFVVAFFVSALFSEEKITPDILLKVLQRELCVETLQGESCPELIQNGDEGVLARAKILADNRKSYARQTLGYCARQLDKFPGVCLGEEENMLYLAACVDNAAVVKYLAEVKGVSLFNKVEAPEGQSTFLHWAARQDAYWVIDYLISRGANVNWLNDARQTSLTLAIDLGHWKVVDLLTYHGADIRAASKKQAEKLHDYLPSGSDEAGWFVEYYNRLHKDDAG